MFDALWCIIPLSVRSARGVKRDNTKVRTVEFERQ